jgi:hypothetical protein
MDSLLTFDDAAAASAMVLSTTIPETSCLQNALLTAAVSLSFAINGRCLRLLLRPLIDSIILSFYLLFTRALALLFSRDHNTSTITASMQLYLSA